MSGFLQCWHFCFGSGFGCLGIPHTLMGIANGVKASQYKFRSNLRNYRVAVTTQAHHAPFRRGLDFLKARRREISLL